MHLFGVAVGFCLVAECFASPASSSQAPAAPPKPSPDAPPKPPPRFSLRPTDVIPMVAAALSQFLPNLDESSVADDLGKCFSAESADEFVRRMEAAWHIRRQETRSVEAIQKIVRSYNDALRSLKDSLEQKCKEAEVDGVEQLVSAVNIIVEAGAPEISPKKMLIAGVDVWTEWGRLNTAFGEDGPRILGWRLGDYLVKVKHQAKRRRARRRKAKQAEDL